MISRIMFIGAQIVSILFHPLIMTTLFSSVLAYFLPNFIFPFGTENSLYFVLLIFVSTYLFPVLGVIFLYYTQLIHSVVADNQKDRLRILFVTGTIYLIVNYFLTIKVRMNPHFMILFWGFSITILISLAITVFWQISLHAIGICGLIVSIWYINFYYKNETLFYPFLISIILGGVVLSSRLHLNKHTPKQLLGGAFLGFVTSIISWQLAN